MGEAFSRMIGAAERANLICGFSPAPLAPTVSHLQFANDTIIFCEAHKDRIKNVKAVLWRFEVVLGLRANFHKSEPLGIRVEEESISLFAKILGCKVGSFPTSYLCLPLCIGRPLKFVGNPVVKRVEKKLSTWKANYL